GMGAGDERCVVVEAEVASALVVVEPELALELAVVELDRPAQPGEPGEAFAALVLGEVGEPVVARRFLALGPLDDQPLPARRLSVAGDGIGGGDADEGEAAGDVLACWRRPADDFLPRPRRQAFGERAHRLRLAIGAGDRRRPAGRTVPLRNDEGRLWAVDTRLRPYRRHVLELERVQITAKRGVVAVGRVSEDRRRRHLPAGRPLAEVAGELWLGLEDDALGDLRLPSPLP